MKKRTLKILKQFKGSAESRKALEKLKSTDRVMDPLAKIRTEAGFVQLIQDLVKTVLDNEGMQMSPGRTGDALDRVKKSFELKNESLIREYIREVIAESDPATTGTAKTVKKIIDRISSGSIENVKKKISGVFKPSITSKPTTSGEKTQPDKKEDQNKPTDNKDDDNKDKNKMSDTASAIAKNPKAKTTLQNIANKPPDALSAEEISLVASLSDIGGQSNQEQEKNNPKDSQKDSQISTRDGKISPKPLKNA